MSVLPDCKVGDLQTPWVPQIVLDLLRIGRKIPVRRLLERQLAEDGPDGDIAWWTDTELDFYSSIRSFHMLTFLLDKVVSLICI